MTRALVVGSVNVDLVVRVPRLPAPGETALGGDARRHPGGKGANQAATLAALGASTSLCAAIGDDADGAWSIEQLAAAGVDSRQVSRVSTAPTGLAMIAVDDAGENVIVVARGANAHCVAPTAVDADVVVCQLEIPVDVVHATLTAARAAGAKTVLNAAPAVSLPAELWPLVDLLVVNAEEAARYGDAMLGAGVCIVTRGAAGATVTGGSGQAISVPAPVVTVVDTTGAGDCFTAAAAFAFATGADPVEAARFAVVAAALSVQAQGARGRLPSRADVQNESERIQASS